VEQRIECRLAASTPRSRELVARGPGQEQVGGRLVLLVLRLTAVPLLVAALQGRNACTAGRARQCGARQGGRAQGTRALLATDRPATRYRVQVPVRSHELSRRLLPPTPALQHAHKSPALLAREAGHRARKPPPPSKAMPPQQTAPQPPKAPPVLPTTAPPPPLPVPPVAPDMYLMRRKVKSGEAAAQGQRSHTVGPAATNRPAHTHISPCRRHTGWQ
jgi:hypothetical protein